MFVCLCVCVSVRLRVSVYVRLCGCVSVRLCVWRIRVKVRALLGNVMWLLRRRAPCKITAGVYKSGCDFIVRNVATIYFFTSLFLVSIQPNFFGTLDFPGTFS